MTYTNNMIDVIYKGRLPERASTSANGSDVRADKEYLIYPGQTVKVDLQYSQQVPKGVATLLMPRSSLHSDLRLTNSIGLIDVDYRGNVFAKFQNIGMDLVKIETDERIGQLLFVPSFTPNFIEGEPDTTERGDGGDGSTGKL